MERLHTEEARQKAADTKANNLNQVADLDDQETHVLIDYKAKTLKIYTNRATVMNRMLRAGYEPKSVDKVDGQVYAHSYEFPMSMVGKFMRTGLFG